MPVTRYEIDIGTLRRMYSLTALLDRTRGTRAFGTILRSLLASVEIVHIEAAAKRSA